MFVKATKAKALHRIGIEGISGSGKTYTALSLAQALACDGNVLLIDVAEGGKSNQYSDKFPHSVGKVELGPNGYPSLKSFLSLVDDASSTKDKNDFRDGYPFAPNSTCPTA